MITITRLPVLALLLLNACSPESSTSTQEASDAAEPVTSFLALETVSNQAHLLSGGDVLMAVATNEDPESIRLQLPSGASYTPLVPMTGINNENAYQTLVSDLPLGTSTIIAEAGAARASMQVSNYSLSGPIISGEQQSPYYCVDELAPDRDGNARQFAIGNGEYLAAGAVAEDCSIATRIDYIHPSNSEFATQHCAGQIGRHDPVPTRHIQMFGIMRAGSFEKSGDPSSDRFTAMVR